MKCKEAKEESEFNNSLEYSEGEGRYDFNLEFPLVTDCKIRNNAFPESVAFEGVYHYLIYNPIVVKTGNTVKPIINDFAYWTNENWEFFLNNVKFSYSVR